MTIHILDAHADSQAWHEILARLPETLHDIYFWPEYAGLGVHTSESRAVLWVYESGERCWCYPFLLGQITHIGSQILTHPWYDIETPYGYGGPLANTDDTGFLTEALRAFGNWCQREQVVAEFIRLHPLIENQRWLDAKVALVFDRTTLSIDLRQSDGSTKRYSKDARNMLRRAVRAGIHTSRQPVLDQMEQFRRLYHRRMELLKADSYYHFSDEYFCQLAQLTESSGWLLAAQANGEWSAGAVFLRGSRWLHYHLSASAPGQAAPGATNQLIDAAVQLGIQSGLETLHLGGGRTNASDDTLLKFKQSMASHNHPFYIGKRVHNPEIYARLKDQWEHTYPELVETYGHRLLCYRYEA